LPASLLGLPWLFLSLPFPGYTHHLLFCFFLKSKRFWENDIKKIEYSGVSEYHFCFKIYLFYKLINLSKFYEDSKIKKKN